MNNRQAGALAEHIQSEIRATERWHLKYGPKNKEARPPSPKRVWVKRMVRACAHLSHLIVEIIYVNTWLFNYLMRLID